MPETGHSVWHRTIAGTIFWRGGDAMGKPKFKPKWKPPSLRSNADRYAITHPGEEEDNPLPPGSRPNDPILTDETIGDTEVTNLWQVPPEVRAPYEDRTWKMPRLGIAAISLDNDMALSAMEHGKCRVKDLEGKIGMKVLAIADVVKSGRPEGQTVMLGLHCWNCGLHTWTTLVFIPTRPRAA
jgi:hypothetical protein